MKKGMKRLVSELLVVAMVLTAFGTNNKTASAEESTMQNYVYDGYEVTFMVTSAWDGAFNADVTISNKGEEVIDNWAVAFDMPHEITNIWNGQVVNEKEGTYIIKNVTSNQDIAVNGTVNFGFTATVTDEILLPASFSFVMKEENVDASLYTMEMDVTNDWETAFTGELVINNISDRTIEDWMIEFDFPYEITNFYTAEIVSHVGNHYVVKNRGYNANINEGQAIALGFMANPGRVFGEPKDVLLKEIVVEKNLTEDDAWVDSDGDFLCDLEEKELGTNHLNTDTDGDGVSDYLEVVNGLDPLTPDLDKMVSSDMDVDGDGLTDYEELVKSLTDPFLYDTDEDGLDDGFEVKHGLNPLVSDTDGDGMPDGKEKILQQLSEKIVDEEKKEIVSVSVAMEVAGDIEKTTKIKNTSGIDLLSSEVVGLVGVPVDITTSAEFTEAVITFTYDETALGEGKEENLRIMWYDEENNQYVILDEETILDTENNTLSYKTTHFSTYLVIDRQEWYDVWNEAVVYGRKPTSGQQTQYVDLCYLIDKSGSMSGAYIDTAKDAIQHFIESMYDSDRGAIVGFDNYATVYQDFTSEKSALHDALNEVYASGGTSVENGLIKALDLFPSSQERYESGIFNAGIILLLCDGDVYYTQSTLERAKTMGIKIYPVLIGSSYGKIALQTIADETGGEFYYAATAEEIREAIFGVQEDTIGELDTTDTDGDGLYDVYETAGMILPNGRYVYTDPANPDMDNDGLTDGEEMGIIKNYEEQNWLKKLILRLKGFDNEVYAEYFDYKSNPLEKDTDGDGYEDKADSNPLIKDVRVVKIKDAEKFVGITEGAGNEVKYYGGDQGWFKEILAQEGACGTVAAANITAYMSRNDEFNKLYAYDDFSKENFMAHMNDMYEFLKPFRIPFTNVPLGIWPMGRFEKAVEEFSRVRGVDFSGVRNTSGFTKENVIDYIESGLKQDAPVAMLIGFNNKLNNIEVVRPNGTSWVQSSFKTHWVVITELTTDEVIGKSTAKVSTWGGYSYLDIDEYLTGENVYECLLYFE